MLMWRDASVRYDEWSFLKEFLKPKDYIFTAVLGHAGMGKSHLVRWLAARIPESSNRKVILVRKAATNLREIIRLIIRDAKGKVFDEYRNQLDAASSDLASPAYAREKFLDNLALETGQNCARGLPNPLGDELKFVVEKLPALLRDPVFRRILLARGNVVERLTGHIIHESNTFTRQEQRRQFVDADIPGKVTDIREFKDASKDARAIFEAFISYPSLRKIAIDWLNAGLNDALAALLSLRNNRLFELMLELRRQLAKENVELVLLVEDFALLQGVDQQLMEALLVRPDQGEGGRLCALRTTLACTSGYYETLPETVRQRVDFTVTLDPPDPQVTTIDGSDLATFAARYLNALRLPERELKAWLERANAHGDSDTPVPSACKDCKYREKQCHGAFGTGGSTPFGLYPFTETALSRMQDRGDAAGPFNPRLVLKYVLKAVLDRHTEDLKNGNFPAAEMRANFRRTTASRLPGLEPGVAFEIQRRDKVDAGRREVLLDLWSNGEVLVNLDPIIHEAFALPELTGIATGEQPPEASPTERPIVEKKTSKLDPLAKQVDEINRWINGDVKLSFDLANELRIIIFGCLSQYFPWDTEFLLASHYKEFRNTSIVFPSLQSLAAPPKIIIRVPRNPNDRQSMAEVGVLLPGLLRFDAAKGWGFNGSARIQRLLAKYLEDWSAQLGDQIRRLGSAEADPVPTGVEALAIGAMLTGQVSPESTDEQVIKEMFGGLVTPDLSERAPAWRQLVQEFIGKRKDIIELVVQNAACTKGGSSRVKILDAAQFVNPLAKLRKSSWRPTLAVPDLPGTADLRRIYESLATSLAKAQDQETERTQKWHARVSEALGDDPRVAEVVRAVLEALKAAGDAGMGGAAIPEVEAAAKMVHDVDVKVLLRRTRTAGEGSVPMAALAALDQVAMSRVSAFTDSAQKALANSKQKIEAWLKSSVGVTGKEVLQLGDKMERDLTQIASDLEYLAGGASAGQRS
jgi:energy-coupling factor transporter ATP-binding protein EcfA2